MLSFHSMHLTSVLLYILNIRITYVICKVSVSAKELLMNYGTVSFFSFQIMVKQGLSGKRQL